jgi:hypothetical protein
VCKCDGGWVVGCRSTNDAPRGDTFFVLVQLCGVHIATGQSRLRISMQVGHGVELAVQGAFGNESRHCGPKAGLKHLRPSVLGT